MRSHVTFCTKIAPFRRVHTSSEAGPSASGDGEGSRFRLLHLASKKGGPVNKILSDYYRCPEVLAEFSLNGQLSADKGFFKWGEGVVCYGRSTSGFRSKRVNGPLYDLSSDVVLDESGAHLPFEAPELLENLLRERYSAHFREPGSLSNTAIRKIYYFLRPFLTMPIRKRLQKIHLRNWDEIPFPQWPVDCTVNRMHGQLMSLAMRAQGIETMPFIWFWPNGAKSCFILTHDVESEGGLKFCPKLMDLDESFGFYSSFQIVPEERYAVSAEVLRRIVDRGFEVNVHDLKHDGRLYAEFEEFKRRAKRINQYVRDFGASGFRSGILYRNADWYDAFEFSYDMSIPNVGHLDPQRGGCCTVLPYFVGDIVELPVTCTQDHTLFNILGDYSIDLWTRQIDLIRENHGLISLLVHPDYVIEQRAHSIYKQILSYIAELRDKGDVWAARPREVADWWRQRSQMRLTLENGSWVVDGPGSEQAQIAFLRVEGDRVSYSFEPEKFPVHCETSVVLNRKARVD